MKLLQKSMFLAALAATCLLTSCTKQEKTIGGVLIGAGSGALIGGAAGGGGGAIAGGVIGAIGGGVIGHSLGDDKHK